MTPAYFATDATTTTPAAAAAGHSDAQAAMTAASLLAPPATSHPAGVQPLVLAKGMSFADGKAAIYFVQDYALQHNKQVRVGCRGGKHRKLVCSSEACPFFVQIYQRHSKADKSWYLSSFDPTHAPSCTSAAKPTKRQLVNMASFKHAMVQTPEASAASLATYVEDQSHVPLRVNLRTVYRAKETLRTALVDKQSQSFRRVTSLLSRFQELNLGSHVAHDVDESGRFLRAFVACGVFTLAMPHSQQVFGFECVPAAGMFPGFHMYLLGKDGNMNTMVVAAAVVATLRGVNEDHLAWFFRCVHAAGVDIQLAPIITTVTTPMLAVEAELGLTFRICTRQLIEKELTKIPAFNEHHRSLVWGLQASETAQEYTSRLHWIATACGQEVAAMLRQLPFERWVLAGSMDQKPLFGYRSRDFSEGHGHGDTEESILEFVQQLQSKLPFDFLDAVMEKWAQDAYQRSSLYEKWVQAGIKITPSAQALYELEMKHIGEFVVTRSSPSVAFVSQVNSNSSTSASAASRCRVDLAENSCTCTFMQQRGIPCRHMIAVALFCGHMDSISDRFAAMYRIETFGSVYHSKGVELPLQTSLTENDDCLPPSMTIKVPRGPKPKNRPPPPAVAVMAPVAGPDSAPSDHLAQENADGQPTAADGASRSPAKKRTQADGATNEVALPISKPKRCSKCKSTGHNVRSCPSAHAAALLTAQQG